MIALLFLWCVLSPRTQPWSVLYRRLIQPRLAPTDLEDPRPPRFAQGVGLFVTGIGLMLHLAGVPWALPIAAALAFVAAFLNAVFGLCLGCRVYLLLQRLGFLGRTATAWASPAPSPRAAEPSRLVPGASAPHGTLRRRDHERHERSIDQLEGHPVRGIG